MDKADKVRYVKRQGQTRDHHCHWPGCKKQVPPAKWGCYKHWMMLPMYLRNGIWQAYRPGQEVDLRPSREYLEVVQVVEEWILSHYPNASRREKMVASRAQSALAKKLGARGDKAVQAAKNNEYKAPGGGELPPNMIGVAQLSDISFEPIKLGKEHAGAPLFMATGTVVLPKVFEGIPVEGMNTRIMITMADLPNKQDPTKSRSLEDQINAVINELKGLDPDCCGDAAGVDDLESIASALVEAAPFFRFRTWKGEKAKAGLYANKEPRVNHVWMGRVEYDPDTGLAGGSLADGTGANGEAGVVTEQGGGDPGDADGAVADLAALAALADQDEDTPEKEKAIDEMQAKALEAGITEDQIKDAPNWTAIAELMVTPQEAGTVEEPPAAAAKDPAKGDMVRYQEVDAKGQPLKDARKKVKKPIEARIEAVDKRTKTVTLKNAEDGKTIIKNVKWDDLIRD